MIVIWFVASWLDPHCATNSDDRRQKCARWPGSRRLGIKPARLGRDELAWDQRLVSTGYPAPTACLRRGCGGRACNGRRQRAFHRGGHRPARRDYDLATPLSGRCPALPSSSLLAPALFVAVRRCAGNLPGRSVSRLWWLRSSSSRRCTSPGWSACVNSCCGCSAAAMISASRLRPWSTNPARTS